MFAYCGNNPVSNYDPTGCFAISLTMLGLIVGAVVGAVAGGVVAHNVAKDSGAEGWELAGWTALGIIGGGTVGGFLGNGAGLAITKLTGILGFSIINGSVYTITETIVLGHVGYTTLGETLGYGYFSFSGQLSDTQIWSMNVQYLSDCGKLGANFIIEATRPLAHPVLECGSWLYLEIQYLLEQGYQWLEDLSALIR